MAKPEELGLFFLMVMSKVLVVAKENDDKKLHGPGGDDDGRVFCLWRVRHQRKEEAGSCTAVGGPNEKTCNPQTKPQRKTQGE